MPWSCATTSRSRSIPRPWSRPIPCHAGRKRAEGLRLDRLDRLPDRGQRPPPDAAKHVGRDPLGPGPAGPELALEDGALGGQVAQLRQHVDPPASRELLRRERPVRTGVAADEPAKRAVDGIQERHGKADRRHGAERVAIEPGVLGGDQPLGACDANPGGSPGRNEIVQVGGSTRRELGPRQIAQPAQQVVRAVGVERATLALELALDVSDRVAVEELSQVICAQELGEQRPVELERLGAPLGRRRVALVHVGRDVVEEERRGEGRRHRRLDLDQAHLPARDRPQEALQRRHLEDVRQHLAVRLEQDRERAVLLRDLLEVVRLQPLLPERRSLPGAAARDEERAGRVLAEPRREERALGDPVDEEVVEVVGRDGDQVDRRRRVGVGQADRDAVVGPQRLHLDPEGLAHALLDGQRPRGVDAPAERREDAHAPVADLVAEPLDDDRAVGRDDARRGLLVVEIGREVARRQLVEVPEPARPRRLAHGPPQLVRPPDAVALPERHAPRHARRRRDEHAVARDLLDPPRRRAQLEDLAGAGLVDHLLVELPHPRPRVGEKDAVEAAVGDRAARGDREPAGVVAAAHDAGRAVPHDPRPKLGELV